MVGSCSGVLTVSDSVLLLGYWLGAFLACSRLLWWLLCNFDEIPLGDDT